jgi:hypothetical protein
MNIVQISKCRVAIIPQTNNDKFVMQDVGPWHEFKTITNNAEELLLELYARKFIGAQTQVFYYDSEGNPTKLLHRYGRFIDFAPSNTDEISGMECRGF